MKQTTLSKFNIYEIIDDQIQRSNIKRTNWKYIFGSSLTKRVAYHYAKGLSANDTYKLLHSVLIKKGIDDSEIFRKLKISISARYAEINSESKVIKQWGKKK